MSWDLKLTENQDAEGHSWKKVSVMGEQITAVLGYGAFLHVVFQVTVK